MTLVVIQLLSFPTLKLYKTILVLHRCYLRYSVDFTAWHICARMVSKLQYSTGGFLFIFFSFLFGVLLSKLRVYLIIALLSLRYSYGDVRFLVWSFTSSSLSILVFLQSKSPYYILYLAQSLLPTFCAALRM